MSRALMWIGFVALLAPAFGADNSDVVLKAMRDELAHSKALSTVNLEKPYFISYSIEDGEAFAATASLGGLIGSTDTLFRVPRVEVRVGDYEFDNTDYVGSGFHFGSRYDIERFPVENLYPALRRYLWLATDQSYKAAVEAIARKRAALKNMSSAERIPDFTRAEPAHVMENGGATKLDRAAWVARVRAISAMFAQFPQVLGSNVELQAIRGVRRLANTEGTEVRDAEDVMFMRIRAVGQAPDGMRLHDAAAIHWLDFVHTPSESDLASEARQVAENVTALSRAPMGETYNGPVLFEGAAAAQLFAQLLGRNLALPRKPVSEPGRPTVFAMSELEGRQGSRILPEWIDVTDDPTVKDWHGRRLFGSYWVDFEGVAAKRVLLVEQGVLRNFLLTRQPVAGFTGSNGRARLPGPYGAANAGISNLFVHAGKTSPVGDLKKQLIDIMKARHDEYGLIVRKLDFPSSAPIEELRRLVAANTSDGGSAHPLSLPVLIYKVYPNGKEELIRGVRFRDVNVRSLRDIRVAGNDTNVFDYLENGAPMALMGAGNYAAETSVVAPSVLIDDVAVRKLDEELPKLPIVPPPLVAGR